MCIPLGGLRQFIWEDFPSSGCCFRSLILHSSACGWIGMWGAVCLTPHWPWTIDKVLLMNWKISSEVDFRQDEKRNYICLGVLGDFSFMIFFQHVYGFEFFTQTRHFWPCDKLVFFLFFYHIPTILPLRRMIQNCLLCFWKFQEVKMWLWERCSHRH